MLKQAVTLFMLIHFSLSAAVTEVESAPIDRYYADKQRLVNLYSCSISSQSMEYYMLARTAINALRYIEPDEPNKELFQFISSKAQHKIIESERQLDRVETLEMRVLCANSNYAWILKNSLFPPDEQGIGAGYLIVEKMLFETQGKEKTIATHNLPHSKRYYELTSLEALILYHELNFNKQ